MKQATAMARANIAFVKYWGKRDAALNLPQAGSLSVTLDGLGTRTTVSFGVSEQDELQIDGQPASGAALAKALRVVDPIRARAGLQQPVRIVSANDFPTGAGLASSASGLAALTVAAAGAAELDLSPTELSVVARLGSGSACRSIFGGYVQWQAGSAANGSDSHARQLFPPEHWDLRVVVAVTAEGPKAVDSTRGMLRTGAASPYHRAFVDAVDGDLTEAGEAIARRDLARLGRVAERSCLRMHAAMMASDPPLIYLTAHSWQVIEAARGLQAAGVGVFFTADAGPNVKLFCEPDALPVVQQTVEALSGVRRTILARPGQGPRVVPA